MSTVEEVLGEKQVDVTSILGPKPEMEEGLPKLPAEADDRTEYIKDQYRTMTGQDFPEVSKIPPSIRAIPPALWDLVKSQIPGMRVFSEEFKQSPWWISMPDLPPEFDVNEFSLSDIEKIYEEHLSGKTESKAGIISEEMTNIASFMFFPTQMKMLGELVGPVVKRYAPKLYNILLKEIKLGKKIGKIPEKKQPPEEIIELTEEIKLKPTKPDAVPSSESEVPLRPESPFESTVKHDPHKAMAEAATESMVEQGIKRDTSKLMTEQLVEEWLKNPSDYKAIIERYGMTPQEWANLMREQASSWGRKLGELGLEARRLGKTIPEIAEAMEELEAISAGGSVWDKIQTGWKNIDRVRRGILVSQLSTAMRNAFTQAGRIGLDIPEKAMNYSLAKLFGLNPKGSALDGVEQFLKVVQRGESKKIADTVLAAFPKQYKRLYATYMSDIEAGTVNQTVSRGVDLLNTANRFQEYLFRNGVFSASLEQELRNSGMNLMKIIESGTVKDIPKEAIVKAVDNALEKTFATTPKYGTIGKAFVDFVTKVPGATFILPFPRFIINSMKFNFEYSPFGMLKLLSSAERKAFAEGDVHVLSRAILGSGMLYTAYQIRNSEYAGEKWFELKVGDKTVNMMAYNPFAAYLFIADIIKKHKDGTLYSLTGKDVSMGMLSSNLRAGTGLYTVDEILNALSKTGDSDKAANLVKTFAGEVVGGFATPLNQIKELLYGFDDYIVREKRMEPFWGPVKEKTPIVERTLPEAYVPTREGPMKRELPAFRQATGIMIRTKNILEKEIDRLGFSYQEIFHSVGDPEADNLIKKYMGVIAERMGIPLIQSEEYKKMTNGQKALVLANLLHEMRTTGKECAEEENPDLFARIKLERIPKREQILLQEQGINIRDLEKQLTQ